MPPSGGLRLSTDYREKGKLRLQALLRIGRSIEAKELFAQAQLGLFEGRRLRARSRGVVTFGLGVFAAILEAAGAAVGEQELIFRGHQTAVGALVDVYAIFLVHAAQYG